jgi:hypothetical protein
MRIIFKETEGHMLKDTCESIVPIGNRCWVCLARSLRFSSRAGQAHKVEYRKVFAQVGGERAKTIDWM